MSEQDSGRRSEQRFRFEDRRYTVRTITRDQGVSVEEVAIEDGARGYITGVVFDSEASALQSAHQLAFNLIEGERLKRPGPLQ